MRVLVHTQKSFILLPKEIGTALARKQISNTKISKHSFFSLTDTQIWTAISRFSYLLKWQELSWSLNMKCIGIFKKLIIWSSRGKPNENFVTVIKITCSENQQPCPASLRSWMSHQASYRYASCKPYIPANQE